jgi:ubiquinone/menaquinone biosynthesis C-methylase UbiE
MSSPDGAKQGTTFVTQANDKHSDSVNLERFSGFAEQYNAYRPSPPAVLRNVLLELAVTKRPKLIVDMGCGTGLSTRYWAETADRVIGIEPNLDMRTRAAAETVAGNITYLDATSYQTTLAEGCADIVTCSQSLHWMEPQKTLTEVARILRIGGVFAAYDYDWPPTTGVWRADAAYEECMKTISAREDDLPLEKRVRKWPKHEHLRRMADSGLFRYTKEIVLHHEETGAAERLVGLLLSQGSVMALLKAGKSEIELGIDRFRRICRETLGTLPRTWYWSSRVRIGVV